MAAALLIKIVCTFGYSEELSQWFMGKAIANTIKVHPAFFFNDLPLHHLFR
jgi:hypothetical protein